MMERSEYKLTKPVGEYTLTLLDLILLHKLELWYEEKDEYHPYPFSVRFKAQHMRKIQNVNHRDHNKTTRQFNPYIKLIHYPVNKRINV
jgi:hypothetical protein